MTYPQNTDLGAVRSALEGIGERIHFAMFTRIFLLSLMSLLYLPAARAATFQVTKTVDEVGECDLGDCSLREAVLAANASPGADIIEVPPGLYQLTIPGA